jgi:CDP-diacylglycerol--glycerol-3-phosphate 3-phosphatidyltransferase
MLSRWFRKWTPEVFRPILVLLHRVGITPNTLTAISLLAAILSGALIATDRFWLAAAVLLFSGLCDSFDGELARQFQQENPLGFFFDSVADHYGDFFIYLGIAYHALNLNDRLGVILCFTTLFGSVAGSHIRARAGMAGIETKTIGIFTRMERILFLFLGLVTGWIIPAVAVLALATNISALQRVQHIVTAARVREY